MSAKKSPAASMSNKESEPSSSPTQTTVSRKTSAANPTAAPAPSTVVYNESAMRNNFTVLEFCRTCQAAASGIASGILGVSAINGFVLYFVGVVIQALCWEFKSGFQWDKFFTSRSLCLNHSLMGGLFTYILFWVFIYGMVHVY
uniref:ER membrane protein complex subunit 6 n=1 Tax=Ditylenchus dipsaci TaxID=166011 RepID=A0A915EAF7_9BILA